MEDEDEDDGADEPLAAGSTDAAPGVPEQRSDDGSLSGACSSGTRAAGHSAAGGGGGGGGSDASSGSRGSFAAAVRPNSEVAGGGSRRAAGPVTESVAASRDARRSSGGHRSLAAGADMDEEEEAEAEGLEGDEAFQRSRMLKKLQKLLANPRVRRSAHRFRRHGAAVLVLLAVTFLASVAACSLLLQRHSAHMDRLQLSGQVAATAAHMCVVTRSLEALLYRGLQVPPGVQGTSPQATDLAAELASGAASIDAWTQGLISGSGTGMAPSEAVQAAYAAQSLQEAVYVGGPAEKAGSYNVIPTSLWHLTRDFVIAVRAVAYLEGGQSATALGAAYPSVLFMLDNGPLTLVPALGGALQLEADDATASLVKFRSVMGGLLALDVVVLVLCQLYVRRARRPPSAPLLRPAQRTRLSPAAPPARPAGVAADCARRLGARQAVRAVPVAAAPLGGIAGGAPVRVPGGLSGRGGGLPGGGLRRGCRVSSLHGRSRA